MEEEDYSVSGYMCTVRTVAGPHRDESVESLLILKAGDYVMYHRISKYGKRGRQEVRPGRRPCPPAPCRPRPARPPPRADPGPRSAARRSTGGRGSWWGS